MEPKDAELIKAFNSGNTMALEELISRYKGPLYAYLLKLLHDRDSADDVFQDVLVKVVRKLGAYTDKDKFASWLFTIAHHAAMDSFRELNRHPAESMDTAPEDVAPMSETLVSGEPEPDEELERRESAARLAAAFERLSPEQREVFLLRHYSGLSFSEIADMLGLPIGTVLARMSRGLARMRSDLKE